MKDKKVIWERKPLIKNKLLRIGLILLISTYLLSVFLTTEIDWQRILKESQGVKTLYLLFSSRFYN